NLSRLELAEMHARRDEHDAAIKLLNDALDREPPPELEERIRLRFGASLVAKNDPKGAFQQFASVAQNLKSPLAPEARLRAGECLRASDQRDIGGDRGQVATATGPLPRRAKTLPRGDDRFARGALYLRLPAMEFGGPVGSRPPARRAAAAQAGGQVA